MRTLYLPASLRQRLNNPIGGELVEGTTAECNVILSRRVTAVKPLPVILVGDTISRNAALSGISADVIIIDNLELRQKSVGFSFGERNLFHVNNYPGTIDSTAWDIIGSAIAKGNSVVIVEGEEDLLTLVAITLAPTGSLVAYGQPGKGIVLVKVSDREKIRVKRIIEEMD